MQLYVEHYCAFDEKEWVDLVGDAVKEAIYNLTRVYITKDRADYIGKYLTKAITKEALSDGVIVECEYGLDEDSLISGIYYALINAFDKEAFGHFEIIEQDEENTIEKIHEYVESLKDTDEYIIIEQPNDRYIAIRPTELTGTQVKHDGSNNGEKSKII